MATATDRDLSPPAQTFLARARARLASVSLGWLPTIVVGIACLGTLGYYGVGVRDLVVFLCYAVVAVVVPGTLLWRAAHHGSGLLVADVAAGTAIGLALGVVEYIPARALGAPLLALLAPAAIIGGFLGLPRLRRFWRGSGQRVPLWWATSVSGLALFVLAWSAATFFRTHGLTWPGNASPYVDMPFHLALAGEVKHHVPPVIPYVEGQPLRYHWFVYAHLASTSWSTGIELQTLLYRLSPLAILLTLTVLIAVAGNAIVRRWWAGPVTVAVTFFATAPNLFQTRALPVTDASVLFTLWLSPTQTFGAALFVPLVILLVELFRGSGVDDRRGRWGLVALLLFTLAGAKATFIPMALAGVVAVLVAALVRTRRVGRAGFVATGLVVAAFVFAQLVLFRGSSGGLSFAPLATVRTQWVAFATGLAPPTANGRASLGAALLLCVLCWILVWPGIIGLLVPRAKLGDPAILLCLGVAAAGIGAALTFAHPGGSQLYFFQSARPYLAIASVAGLAAVLPRGRLRLRAAGILATAIIAGALLGWLIPRLSGPRVPTRATEGGTLGLLVRLYTPYLVLIAVAALAVIGVLRLARRNDSLRGLAWATGLIFIMASCLPSAANLGRPLATALTKGWLAPVTASAATAPIPDGAIAAGRWLRDHSSPQDLVATNVHCRTYLTSTCENRHFFVSAYTERRVLVEGWGYTSTTEAAAELTGVPHTQVPFWDTQVLADNDRAFQQPSAQSLARLRDQYGVRWLFVDRRFNTPAASLAAFAELRFTAGDCQVYEISG